MSTIGVEDVDAASGQESGATFVVDPRQARLVEANAAARGLWGLEAASENRSAGQIELDAAMPALQVLRATPLEALEGRAWVLTFWTPRGVLSLACRVRGGRDDGAVAITVMGAGAPSGVPGTHLPDGGEGVTAIERLGALPRETMARLGHELRTPLAAILSLADVMAKGHFGPLGNVRYEDYARSIREAARHSLAVVGAMLDPDAIGRPLAVQTFTEVDLNAVVTDAVRSIEPLAVAGGGSIGLDLSSGLPWLIVDRLAVQQMVLNLLANALAHAGANGGVTVRTGGMAGGETWLDVEDRGPGVPASVVAALTQGTAAGALGAFTSTVQGGLGLRLVRALAEANGARLDIATAIPHGARVRIAFSASRAVPV